MKTRFGVGLDADTTTADFGAVVDTMERSGIDSLWLSEQVYSNGVEPFVGMAYALARTARLKVGTSVAVLPGRHPVLVAKQLATLAGLAPKRVLPVFGLRPGRADERDLFKVPQGRRAAVFDESVRLLKSALSAENVRFDGEFFSVDDARVGPVPPRPLDIWLSGSAPAGLRRIGRFADGWLTAFITPEAARRGRETILATAAEEGREIEDDHFGISIILAENGQAASIAAEIKQYRPEFEPDVIAGSWSHLHRLLDGYQAAGLTKFVIFHRGPQPFDEYADQFVAELLPREN